MFASFERSLGSKTSYGFKVVTAPEPLRGGSVAERFELRSGDCTGVPEWDDCKNDRERTELMQQPPFIDTEKDNWIAWSIYFPGGYRNIFPVKVALGQFHQRGAQSPPLMFQNGKGGYWADLNQLGLPPALLIPEEQLTGRWHDILVNAGWTKKRDGYVRIWVNGVLKFHHSGPNLKQDGEIYFKYGIYRSFLSRFPKGKNIPHQVVYFDEVKWGKSRQQVEMKRASGE